MGKKKLLVVLPRSLSTAFAWVRKFAQGANHRGSVPIIFCALLRRDSADTCWTRNWGRPKLNHWRLLRVQCNARLAIVPLSHSTRGTISAPRIYPPLGPLPGKNRTAP